MIKYCTSSKVDPVLHRSKTRGMLTFGTQRRLLCTVQRREISRSDGGGPTRRSECAVTVERTVLPVFLTQNDTVPPYPMGASRERDFAELECQNARKVETGWTSVRGPRAKETLRGVGHTEARATNPRNGQLETCTARSAPSTLVFTNCVYIHGTFDVEIVQGQDATLAGASSRRYEQSVKKRKKSRKFM